jgi:hypothetical protein
VERNRPQIEEFFGDALPGQGAENVVSLSARRWARAQLVQQHAAARG